MKDEIRNQKFGDLKIGELELTVIHLMRSRDGGYFFTIAASTFTIIFIIIKLWFLVGIFGLLTVFFVSAMYSLAKDIEYVQELLNEIYGEKHD